jgi:hypothetical protein
LPVSSSCARSSSPRAAQLLFEFDLAGAARRPLLAVPGVYGALLALLADLCAAAAPASPRQQWLAAVAARLLFVDATALVAGALDTARRVLPMLPAAVQSAAAVRVALVTKRLAVVDVSVPDRF